MFANSEYLMLYGAKIDGGICLAVKVENDVHLGTLVWGAKMRVVVVGHI